MATASLTHFAIPKSITRKVSRARRFIRSYVLIEGVAAVVLAIGAAFWLALAIDWLFEPSPAVRVGMWMVSLAAIGFVAWKYLFSRLFAKFTDSNVALLIERTFPQLGEGLVTAVQATRSPISISSVQEELLAKTTSQADRNLSQIRLSGLFRYRPLFAKVFLAAAVIAAIVSFAILASEAYGFWLSRMALSPELWPRTIELSVVGFAEQNGEFVANVARDDDFELDVLASLVDKHAAPEQVEIHYELADGRRGRDLLTKIGDATAGTDEAQAFRYDFKNLSSDISFDIIGGDDRIRGLRLHVVERPQIVHTALECEFPKYLGWSPQSLPFNGRVEVPFGSTAICKVEVNKPLQEVRIHDANSNDDVAADVNEKDQREFSFPLERLTEDRILLVDMKDHDGVSNREPYRLLVSVVADEVPEIGVQLRGIGSAVTPQATIPFVGSISDDHGVEEAWIEGEIKDRDSERRALTKFGSRENEELGRFDLAAIDNETRERLLLLEPGQQITLSAKARDAYDLDKEPHVGSSQKFVLDVVTDSQLRSLLEKRELGLRQRFEALHEKMISTRELLSRVEPTPKNAEGEALVGEELTAQRERDGLRVVGVEQNVTQTAFEILGVAEGFEDIVVELQNNRIDTEELTQRLGRDIAEPLRTVATELLPELEKRVQKLSAALDDPAEVPANLSAAIIQSDEVIAAMQRILDRMLELESYNELVELLREIVADQKQLNEETKVQRREKLRSLLDDE